LSFYLFVFIFRSSFGTDGKGFVKMGHFWTNFYPFSIKLDTFSYVNVPVACETNSRATHTQVCRIAVVSIIFLTTPFFSNNLVKCCITLWQDCNIGILQKSGRW